MSMATLPRRNHGGGSDSLFFITVAAASKKRKFKKTREFTQNFHFKERYTVKLDEFHRLAAIDLV
jgi:hypothetical protein